MLALRSVMTRRSRLIIDALGVRIRLSCPIVDSASALVPNWPQSLEILVCSKPVCVYTIYVFQKPSEISNLVNTIFDSGLCIVCL